MHHLLLTREVNDKWIQENVRTALFLRLLFLHSTISTRGCLLLLEIDSPNWNTHANAEGSEHSKAHLQLLVFHLVQVIHVFGMHVGWFIMAVITHSLHST